jgi:hypothetical protein
MGISTVTTCYYDGVSADQECFSPVSISTNAPALKNGLISWWTLNEAEFATRLDSHGPNHLDDDPSRGDTASVAGHVGNAAHFIGTTGLDYDTLENITPTTLAGANDWSIAGWVNFDALGVVDQSLVSSCKGSTGGTAHFDWYITHDFAADRFKVTIVAGVTTAYTLLANTFGAPSTGTWYFFYVYHDSTGREIGISINDGVIDTATYTGTPNNIRDRFQLGRLSPQFPTYLNGKEDEVGFWGRLLTTEEVTELYGPAGAGITYTDLTF